MQTNYVTYSEWAFLLNYEQKKDTEKLFNQSELKLWVHTLTESTDNSSNAEPN